MWWRRYWVAQLLLVAALNIAIGFWTLNGASIANFVCGIFAGWVAYRELRGRLPRVRGPLVLPKIDQLSSVIPAAAAVAIAARDPLASFKPSSPSGRALKLLLSYLDEGQRAEFLATETFTFLAPSGRWFRVLPTTFYGLHEVRNPKVWMSPYDRAPLSAFIDKEVQNIARAYCAYPRSVDFHSLPMEDVMLAIYVRILADEKGFMRVANHGSASALVDYFTSAPFGSGRRGTCLRTVGERIRHQGWPAVFEALEERQAIPPPFPSIRARFVLR